MRGRVPALGHVLLGQRITEQDDFVADLLVPLQLDKCALHPHFEDARRGEVIEYVTNKYGRDHVAQIVTFGTMAARAAILPAGVPTAMSRVPQTMRVAGVDSEIGTCSPSFAIRVPRP